MPNVTRPFLAVVVLATSVRSFLAPNQVEREKAEDEYDEDIYGNEEPVLVSEPHDGGSLWVDGASAPEAVTNSSVTMVLLDRWYLGLFNCWATRFFKFSSKRELHLVALDSKAANHTRAWQAAHPDLPVKLFVAPRPVKGKKRPGPMLKAAEYIKRLKQKGPNTLRWKRSNRTWQKAPKPRYLRQLTGQRHATVWPSDLYQREIWRSLRQRLGSGYKDVLHVDLDAWYMADPWPVLDSKRYSPFDLVASIDDKQHCYPADVCKTWHNNFGVINIGFTLFRNTPATRAVVDHLDGVWARGEAPREPHNFSDQFMLNRHIASLGCHWGPKSPDFAQGYCGDVAMALLSTDYVNRKYPGTLIAHGKNGPLLKEVCGSDVSWTQVRRRRARRKTW